LESFFKSRRGFLVLRMMARSRRELAKAHMPQFAAERRLGDRDPPHGSWSRSPGARWSGPRFFGLRQRPLDSSSTADPLGRGAAKPTQPISLKPGTRLVREWRGVTHTVLIHADGIEWRGQRYRSLSLVARKITGRER
jgi:hypothetical protein